ncbi:CocE/NonD family hydrolase [Mesorhizobium sp. LSJC264A00]|uniref:CocE/NonD family hydrolase n=1 Tax=unclassified Mesorhizobium TaxID=325217 RepID=UPI0003CF50CF|nr:CocE/NonD family hydrolase [Mesorhizobium sp. LSJC264A00]ESX28795.1 peptidase S15 [Mesorhizobium sp. LSJC264A00]
MSAALAAAVEVEVSDHVLIKLSDGVRLSARIWLPKVIDQPVPALLEYIPYRKGDVTAPRDARRHSWYAAHGYGSVRVDIRGTGDSEGLMSGEYSAQELADAVEVINWLAAQPWCNGRVGMFGISYGGFNSLQVAALAPEPLKAIVTVCSSDDLYGTDAHYFGGAVCGETIDWGTWQLAVECARPPDPTRVGPGWKEQWLQRLHALEPWSSTWLRHQTRDEYWKRASVCEDYGAIKAAVLAVGGFNDLFRNTVFQLVEHLSSPVKGIVGPWAHHYPNLAHNPGPAIGYLQETLRWWDRYLKDAETGVEDDPALRVYVQDAVLPATSYTTRLGRWVTEPSWPSPNITTCTMGLGDMFCHDAVGLDLVQVDTPEHCGIDGGRNMPKGGPADLPADQREEDNRSVCFDTEPLTQAVTVLGMPAAKLCVHADGAAANMIVRLCDVAPDGASTLVTRGFLNLQRREGMDRAVDLPAGSVLEVTVPMIAAGYEFPAGHRIRLAVSTAYWPFMWPHPVPAQVALDPAGGALVLPVRGADAPSEPVRFEPPEQGDALPADAIPVVLHTTEPGTERQVHYNPETLEWRITIDDPNYSRSLTYPDGLRYEERAQVTCSIRSDDPASARCNSEQRCRLQRPGWDVEISATGTMHVEHDNFVTEYELTATLDGEQVHHRTWHDRIPRSSRGNG